MSIQQFAGYVAVGTLIIAGIVFGISLLIQLQSLVVLVIIAIVLAAGIAPLVTALEKRRIPRALAILMVYAGAFLVLTAIGAFIGSIIFTQSIEFSRHLPAYLTEAQDRISLLQHRYTWLPNLSHIIQQAPAQLQRLGSRALESVPQIFGFLGSLVSFASILVINFYILMTHEQLRESILGMFPKSNRKKAGEVFAEMGCRMGGWLRGQLLLALIVGVVTTAALAAMRIPYAGLIGLIAALAELIPMVGPAVAAIPTVLVTLIAGAMWQTVASIIFFTLLSQIDSSYMTPRIMNKQVGISPLATVLALLIGASLLGAVGALLAIPLAAALQVVFTEVIIPAIHRAGEGSEPTNSSHKSKSAPR